MVFNFLNRTMTIANATTDSAAATVITSMLNNCPLRFESSCPKATRLILAALKINSIPINTYKILRRVKTIAVPMLNNKIETMI